MSTQTRRSFASFTSAIVSRHVRGVPRLGAIIAAAGLLAALSLTGAAAARAADAPVNPLSVSPISVTTKQGQAVTIQLLGSGPAGDQLFYGVGVALAVGFGPVATAHGSVAMETNTLFPSRAIYTPVAGFSGTDSFNYRVSDSAFDSPVATVTVTVTPVAADNHAPTATPGSFTVESQQQATFVPTGTDPDGDALAFAVVTPPAHGNFQIIPGQSTWYYDPTSGYSGPDSFTFTASDGTLTSAPATVSITITPVRANTPPTSVPPNVVTAQDTPITFTITASDAENDPTEIDLESNVQHGTLTNDGAGHFTYTPTLGYSGSDSFLYFVSDFRSGSPDYLVSITVTPAQVPNHAPTVLPVSVGTQAAPVAVTLLGSDPDGDPLTYATAGGPTHGTLSGTGANLTYTPNAGFFGTDGFTYTASDGVHVSTPAAVQITVTSAGIPFTFPSVDVSVSTDQKQAAAKVVSPKLTTAGADRLLVAFVTVDGPTSATQKVSSVTGGGLTWSLVTRANSTWGTAEIWQAHATSKLAGAAVTAKFAKSGFDASLTVTAFANAAGAVGTSATASGTSGAPSVTVAPHADGSLIWATGHDWTHAAVPIPLVNQTIRHAFVDKRVDDSFWTESFDAPTTNFPITIGTSTPSTDRWQLVGVEIPSAVTLTFPS